VSGIVLIRGGGDLASGVALRLYRSGLKVVITELAIPLAVRRTVSFSEAVFQEKTKVEEVTACLIKHTNEVPNLLHKGIIPVLVDPLAVYRFELAPLVVVDARMTKESSNTDLSSSKLIIGLGPGFKVGTNCHAAVETRRGISLGRVIWHGEPEPDTGLPDPVSGYREERVLRSPSDGILEAISEIGDYIQEGSLIADVAGFPINALFSGLLRGLLRSGTRVSKGLKIGDLDPRDDSRLVQFVSDKSLAVGGGVLEAILTKAEIRTSLW